MQLILFLDLFYRSENQSHTAGKWQSQTCILAVSGGAHGCIQHATLPPSLVAQSYSLISSLSLFLVFSILAKTL